MTSNSQEKAYEEAKIIETELDVCIAGSLTNDAKLVKCRALLKRLHVAFDGWQSPVSDKVSNPLHWKVTDFIVSITDKNGKATG